MNSIISITPHNDISIVTQLLMELDQFHHETDPIRFPLYPFDQRKKFITKVLSEGWVFHCAFDGEIVGFATVLNKRDSLFVEHLFVRGEFRGKGLGSKLLTEIFNTFPDKDILTSVYFFNKDAIAFYEKFFSPSSIIFRKNEAKEKANQA